jgi:hypothetical protein
MCVGEISIDMQKGDIQQTLTTLQNLDKDRFKDNFRSLKDQGHLTDKELNQKYSMVRKSKDK